MSDRGDVPSSGPSNENNPASPVTAPPIAVSRSAAFLHHLHHDPSSHHITLPAPFTRDTGASGSKSPQGMSSPLGSGMPAADTPPMSPGLLARSEGETSLTGLGPVSSKRSSASGSSQKQTAGTSGLGLMDDDAFRTTSPGGESVFPDVDDDDDPSPDNLPHILSEDDCIAAAMEPPSDGGMTEALEMLSLAESSEAQSINTSSSSVDSASSSGSIMPSVSSDSAQPRGIPTPSPGRSLLIGRAGVFSASASTSALVMPQDQPLEQLNWKTFARSYARGLFDPHKIPNPPKDMNSSSPTSGSVHSSPGKTYALRRPTSLPKPQTSNSSSSYVTTSSGASAGSSATTALSSAPTTSTGSSQLESAHSVPTRKSMAEAMAQRRRNFELEELPIGRSEATEPQRTDNLAIPSYSFAAATVRMASTNLRPGDFAPLGMPSPERELVDPMTAVVSPDPLLQTRSSASSDPGSSRAPLNRSMSTAFGSHNTSFLPTIQASPVTTPNEGPHYKGKSPDRNPIEKERSPLSNRGGVPTHRLPAASAPLERAVEAETATDYFSSNLSPPGFDRQQSYVSQSSSSKTATTVTATPNVLPRTQTPEAGSSPEPEAVYEKPPSPSELGTRFEDLGYLQPPMPPDETARRKALYRYNILHTSPDVNFDRIAHMAKLVFSAKYVLITMVDADVVWHKANSLEVDETSRASTFCGHTILAKSGEPFVILDAAQDWRFANNPHVLGPPFVKFYAGAPLITPDGYNVGSLCIIDEKPRADFPPRSRLILKEFAAIAMREMELWRDKLQIKVRDKIQNSMEQFTRECLEMDSTSTTTEAEATSKMDRVYNRAAQLVCQTLDLDGCFILDIGQFEMMEMNLPTGKTTIYRADPYINETQSPVLERSEAFGPVNSFPIFASTPNKVPTRPLSSLEHEKLSEFLRDHKDGRIFEGIAPSWIRYMFPSDLKFGLVVPVYGLDQQPFAMLCAFTSKKSKQYLEGYELQFLRAIGVIILSAVLRRRMILADKAKSILISSVSHELRTPLHGILAAAELLTDTQLDVNQISFLKTVQTCANSLIETVNHVLDFTKLSGSSQSVGGSSIKLARVKLAKLVETTVESCWIGQRARLFHGDAELGSFYAPPAHTSMVSKTQRASVQADLAHVETVIDIAQREKGWMVRCERGGLRRVLMNLVGNSLKFTKDGYIQVTLRELPHPAGAKRIPIEIAVIDTGRGIGKEFLKQQLFHPFSQENPLQTGTGLGLAIVNSIVQSDNVNGTVDVWSSEGMGTEIRVSFEAEVIDDDDEVSSVSSSISMASHPGRGRSISFLGFKHNHRGQMLSLEVLSSYAASWGFDLTDGDDGDLLVIHEDEEILRRVHTLGYPIIFLTPGRSDIVNSIKDSIARAGGSLQVLHKPIGPGSFIQAIAVAVDFLNEQDGYGDLSSHGSRPHLFRESSDASTESASTISELNSIKSPSRDHSDLRAPLVRRRSAEPAVNIGARAHRPALAPRGVTYHTPQPGPSPLRHKGESPDDSKSVASSGSPQPGSPSSTLSTISLADGGVMLKAAAVSASASRKGRVPRVLVVEDNVVNRQVLGAFLRKKGIEYIEAVDGQAGLETFREAPPNHFDVILMDISMPVMNGHEATRAVRAVEAERRHAPADVPAVPPPGVPIRIPPPNVVQSRAKIFALTGLATPDDKREAFGSGVDGYLVKPVSLKSLGLIFQKIGFPIDL